MNGRIDIKFRVREYAAITYRLHGDDDKTPTFRELIKQRNEKEAEERKKKERMKEITNTLWNTDK